MYPEYKSNLLAIKNREYTTKITGKHVGKWILSGLLGLDLTEEVCYAVANHWTKPVPVGTGIES